jgi:hypothetical protein
MKPENEIIYHATTVEQALIVAKNSEYYEARFVIDFEGKLHCGDGYYFIHSEIYPYFNTFICGYIFYNQFKRIFEFRTTPRISHPVLDEFIAYKVRPIHHYNGELIDYE